MLPAYIFVWFIFSRLDFHIWCVIIIFVVAVVIVTAHYYYRYHYCCYHHCFFFCFCSLVIRLLFVLLYFTFVQLFYKKYSDLVGSSAESSRTRLSSMKPKTKVYFMLLLFYFSWLFPIISGIVFFIWLYYC